jgi:membrane protease YdiL (CAAX protease family)
MTIDLSPVEQPIQSTLPYHLMPRGDDRTARWWLPLSTLGVAAGLYVAMLVVAFLVALVGVFVLPASWAPSEMLEDPRNPMDLLLMLGLIVLMLPAAILGSRWGGGMPGVIHSIAGRIRWRLLLRAAVVVIPLFAMVYTIDFVVAPPADFSWPSADGRILAVFVIILLLTPLQCAAEEYAFRALPQQMFGTWLRSPLWGILVPVPLFMIGHGYDWVGQIGIAVFAICMGFLVWKSGGLELAIVVHTGNNLILFLLAPLSPSSLGQMTVTPGVMLMSVALTLGVTTGLTWWISRSRGLGWFEPLRSLPVTKEADDTSVPR